jgi:cytochrome c oxidase subunit 1
LARAQLWLWFWGIMITTIPWHITGLMGQPRHIAVFDYSDPFVARMGPLVIISVVGGAMSPTCERTRMMISRISRRRSPRAAAQVHAHEAAVLDRGIRSNLRPGS